MIEYDGGDEKGLRLWNPEHLNLSIRVMDNWTFIEWIERYFETPVETAERDARRIKRHAEWHSQNYGIFGCCISGPIQANKIVTGAIQALMEKEDDD